MRALPLLAALVAAAATTALTAQDPARDTAEATAKPKKLAVRVLYAGDQDHPRTEQWRGFLGRYFTKVGTIQLSELSTNATEGFDVVIVDSPTPYGTEPRFKMPAAPVLDDTYDRPTILMGAAGGSVIRKARIKIGWL
ncbi:MAG: hypothetical protein ACYTGW_12265 [Planctomycetota bacterium]|jgi:hypothetical protein